MLFPTKTVSGKNRILWNAHLIAYDFCGVNLVVFEVSTVILAERIVSFLYVKECIASFRIISYSGSSSVEKYSLEQKAVLNQFRFG